MLLTARLNLVLVGSTYNNYVEEINIRKMRRWIVFVYLLYNQKKMTLFGVFRYPCVTN